MVTERPDLNSRSLDEKEDALSQLDWKVDSLLPPR